MRASVPLTFASRLHAALTMSRGLALANIPTEDEEAMRSFPCSVMGNPMASHRNVSPAGPMEPEVAPAPLQVDDPIAPAQTAEVMTFCAGVGTKQNGKSQSANETNSSRQ